MLNLRSVHARARFCVWFIVHYSCRKPLVFEARKSEEVVLADFALFPLVFITNSARAYPATSLPVLEKKKHVVCDALERRCAQSKGDHATGRPVLTWGNGVGGRNGLGGRGRVSLWGLQ